MRPAGSVSTDSVFGLVFGSTRFDSVNRVNSVNRWVRVNNWLTEMFGTDSGSVRSGGSVNSVSKSGQSASRLGTDESTRFGLGHSVRFRLGSGSVDSVGLGRTRSNSVNSAR
ncbi:hypothetical protein Hdeb2414_s0019g00543631 [Helianthus debilis subsp. tardiflorus]